MEDDGIPLPPCDWVIEPQGLRPNVITARTLFSDTQPQLVACILNNSLKDKSLSANSFLSMAKPVQCLSGTGYEPASSMFGSSSSNCDAVLSKESALPVLSSPLSHPMLIDETELRTSSVSTATVEATASDSSSSFSSEGQLDHIESLLCSLPDDLTLNQKQHAETFIRSRANVFSRSEYDIGRTNITPASIVRTLSSCVVTRRLNFRLSTLTLHPTYWRRRYFRFRGVKRLTHHRRMTSRHGPKCSA